MAHLLEEQVLEVPIKLLGQFLERGHADIAEICDVADDALGDHHLNRMETAALGAVGWIAEIEDQATALVAAAGDFLFQDVDERP